MLCVRGIYAQHCVMLWVHGVVVGQVLVDVCKHVAALLYFTDYVELSLSNILEDRTCTDSHSSGIHQLIL